MFCGLNPRVVLMAMIRRSSCKRLCGFEVASIMSHMELMCRPVLGYLVLICVFVWCVGSVCILTVRSLADRGMGDAGPLIGVVKMSSSRWFMEVRSEIARSALRCCVFTGSRICSIACEIGRRAYDIFSRAGM